MNICLVCKTLPPKIGYGGIGTYTYDLSHGLAALGHNVHVISEGEEEKEFLDGAVRIHQIKQKNIRGFWRIESFFPIHIILHAYVVSRKLNSLIKKYNIEVIEFSNWFSEGVWFLLFHKQKVTVTRLVTPYAEIQEIKQKKLTMNDRLISWFENESCRRSDILISSTRVHKENIFKLYNLKNKNVFIIPFGISTNNIDKVSNVNNFNKSNFNILYVSRLEERKGTQVLLRVVKDLVDVYPQMHFYFIGKDKQNKYQEWFKQNYKEYLANVHFLGYLLKEEVEMYYKSCDLFVVPSIYESFGLIYLEAMKYGKPVIGCKTGGIPEVVKDGETGLLATPDDKQSLFEKIVFLYKNKNFSETIGKNAEEVVRQKFTIESMSFQTAQVYECFVNKQKQAVN